MRAASAASETVSWEAGVETQERAREEPSGDGRARYSEIDLPGQFSLSAQGPDGRATLPRLGWRTAVEWGLDDFSPLSGQLARLIVGQLPSRRFVRTLGIDTMVELTHAFSRRLQLAVAAGIERGAGWHDAVAVLAIQASPPGRWF